MGPKSKSKGGGAPKAPVQVVAMDPAQLSAVLTQLGQGDTKLIKAAEAALKPFLKHPACIAQLFVQLTQSPTVAVRHHAALLLKKKISAHYKAFPVAEQTQLRAQILQCMTNEPERSVAVGIVGCVAKLASAVFATEGNVWDELFASLMSLSQNPNPAARAINFSLLEQLAETIAPKLKPHMATIAQLLTTGCADPEQQVKIGAMKACVAMITHTSDSVEVMALEPILPPLIAVMQHCLQAGEEELVSEAMDVVQECASMEQPLINNHIDALIPFIVSILENKEFEEQIKQSATYALIQIIENRPKLIGKKNMVPPILNAMVGLIAAADGKEVSSLFQIGSGEGHLDEEADDEEYDEEEGLASRNPQYILDTLAMAIPSKYFVQPALAVASQCISAADPQHRKAGCFLLGVITEGCADSLRIILEQILPAVLTAVKDPEYFVREVACFTLGQMSEHCQPEILHYHSSILPVIFGALDDERPNVQNTICYVLEFFCENLQPETLKPHLELLLTKLCNLLNSPSKTTKEMALTAIAATSVAAEKEFLPFADTICGLLQPLLFATEEKDITLRGRALECLGHIAVALDKELFAKYFPMGMQSALASLQMENETIKEYAYVFFANTAKIMQEQLGPSIDTILPAICESIGELELELDIGSDEEEEYDEEGSDDEDGRGYKVTDGIVQTKKAAITALGTLAQHCGPAVFTAAHLEQGFKVLMEDGLQTVHSEVRAEVLEVLGYMIDSAVFHFGPVTGLPKEPKKGVAHPLAPQLTHIATVALGTLLKTMVHDDEKRVVAAAIESIAHILEKIGMAGLALQATIPDTDDEEWVGMQIVQVLMQALTTAVMEKSTCQTQQVEHGDDDDDDEDHDHELMDQVSDLIGVLAKVLGEQFVPYFDTMAAPLLKFTKPQRAHTDRSMAIGCFAEVIGEIGAASMKFVDALLPAIQSGLQDPMEGVRRNCAYCIATLVHSTGDAMVPNFMTLLQWLSPLCTRTADKAASDTGGADIDNALSAVARMIAVSKAAIPLAQVLPVMLASLPLRADLSEGQNIFGVLSQLLNDSDPAAMSLLPQLVIAFGQTIEPGTKHNDETRALTIRCMRNLAQKAGPALMAAIAAVPDEAMKAVLMQAAQGQ